MKKINHMITAIAIGCLTVSNFSSCSGDDGMNDNKSQYPRDVTVIFTASSTTSSIAESLSYTNETGGRTDLDDVSLPFSVTINRKVDFADFAAMNALVISSVSESTLENITVEIQIDGKVVDTETGSGTGGATADAFFLFE